MPTLQAAQSLVPIGRPPSSWRQLAVLLPRSPFHLGDLNILEAKRHWEIAGIAGISWITGVSWVRRISGIAAPRRHSSPQKTIADDLAKIVASGVDRVGIVPRKPPNPGSSRGKEIRVRLVPLKGNPLARRVEQMLDRHSDFFLSLLNDSFGNEKSGSLVALPRS